MMLGVRRYEGLHGLARRVHYKAGHMEMQKPGLLRLPQAKVPDLTQLNDWFYMCTHYDIIAWARCNDVRVNKTAAGGSEILWLHEEGFSPIANHIAVMIIVPRPLPDGFQPEFYDADRRFKAVISSPVANGLCVDSVYEVAVGDAIILEAGQSLHSWRQSSGRHMDMSILYNMHLVESKQGKFPDPHNWIE